MGRKCNEKIWPHGGHMVAPGLKKTRGLSSDTVLGLCV